MAREQICDSCKDSMLERRFWLAFGALFGHVSESSPRRWRGFLGLLWEPFCVTVPFHFASIFQAAFKRSPRRWRGFLWSSLGALFGRLFPYMSLRFLAPSPKALHAAGVAFWVLFGRLVWRLFLSISLRCSRGLLFEHFSCQFSSASPAAFKRSPLRWRGLAFFGETFSLHVASGFRAASRI